MGVEGMAIKDRININVWSDYVCPFCYLEEPILNQLHQEYPDAIRIEWRAFELRREPVPMLDPNGEYLRTTWKRSVYPMAQERGMTLRLPSVQPRSRRALEAAEFAREKERFEAMHHALFRAFFEEGLDLNDLDVLLKIGTGVGLEREGLRAALETGQYTQRVIEDERQASELGITGVPTMLITLQGRPLEQAIVVSGAQPYEAVRPLVERVLQKKTARA